MQRLEAQTHCGYPSARTTSGLVAYLDGVLRRRAWQVADQLGWASTFKAEYVALTLLQADAFVTMDAELARSLEGIVATASIDDLR